MKIVELFRLGIGCVKNLWNLLAFFHVFDELQTVVFFLLIFFLLHVKLKLIEILVLMPQLLQIHFELLNHRCPLLFPQLFLKEFEGKVADDFLVFGRSGREVELKQLFIASDDLVLHPRDHVEIKLEKGDLVVVFGVEDLACLIDFFDPFVDPGQFFKKFVVHQLEL